MVTYIYADLLFIINLFADYLVLFLTSKFTCARASLARLVFASLFGALFGTLALCLGTSGVVCAALLIAVSALMCFFAFGRRKLRSFTGLMFFFYLSATLLYGGMYAMQSFLSMLFGYLGNNIGFIFIIVLLAAAAAIYTLTSAVIARGVKKKGGTAKIELYDGYRTYELNLLCDTGNLAHDPFSGKPVTVISKNSVDAELLNALCNAFGEKKTDSSYSHIKPRVIPIKTVSGTALLYAFVPQSMFVYVGKEKRPLDSIVAIDTHENAFFGNDGIIPGELLEFV